MNAAAQPIRDVELLLSSSVSQLACGAEVDELLEQAADGRAGQLTAHQRDCVHCQAALHEFARIWEPVRRQAAVPVLVPAALRAAVTAQIRRLTADIWYTLDSRSGGIIRIAARVIAVIAREAAGQVPGVKVAFGQSTQPAAAGTARAATLGHRHPDSAAGVLGRAAVVNLAIAAQYGQPLDHIARQVQRRAITELRAKTDLRDITVNVTVDDVLD